MNTLALLTIALLSITVLAVTLAFATAFRRALRETYERRRARRAEAVRLALLALAAGDHSPEILEQLDVADRVLARAVTEVLPRVRGEARDGLVALMEQHGFVVRTIARTRSRSVIRRAAAAETLGWMGVPRTLPTLARLLEDPETEVVQVATRALGRMGDPAAVPFLLAAIETSPGLTPGQVSAALRHLGGDVASRLSDAIEHANADIRLVAVEVLSIVGTATVADRLALALDDPEPAVRVGAAHALGRIGGQRAVEPLLRCLRTFDAQLRAAAAVALGQIGDPYAIAAWVSAVNDPDTEVARAASYALVEIGPEGTAALEEPAARHPVAAAPHRGVRPAGGAKGAVRRDHAVR
jgi:hypothetical protein